MAVTDITRVSKRVVSILFANRLSPYAGTASGSNSRYQVTQEITDAILEADSVIVQARIATPGDPYRAQFMAVSSALASGALIPAHVGSVGGIEVAIGGTYAAARFARSREEVIALQTHPALYPDAERWGAVLDGILYHNGSGATGRVWRSTFTKTVACQSPDVDELAVIALTLGSLAKDGAVTPEIYSMGLTYAQWYIVTQIKGQVMPIPDVEQIEARLAA